MASVGGVVYQIYVNDILYRDLALVMDVELRECFSRHDLMFIRVEYTRTYPNIANLRTWADGARVMVVWGRRPDLNVWYGYVNHSEIRSDADSGSRAQQVTYVCIGTSAGLNADKTRTWKQVSPTYIAKALAREQRMRCVVTGTDWVFDYEVQAGESDFHFLARLADKVGMRFWCSGGTLYLIDPAVALYGSAKVAVPQYVFDKRLDNQDTLRDFRLFQGENLPGAVVANRAIYGIDQSSGNPFVAVSSPSPASGVTYVNSQRPVTSYQEAQRLVTNWRDLSQFWVAGKAQVFGSTLLYPGKLVFLSGQGLMDGMGGYWLVTSARHLLKVSGVGDVIIDRFVTDIEIVRNSKAADVSVTGAQRVIPEMVPCKVNAGMWASGDLSVLTAGAGA